MRAGHGKIGTEPTPFELHRLTDDHQPPQFQMLWMLSVSSFLQANLGFICGTSHLRQRADVTN